MSHVLVFETQCVVEGLQASGVVLKSFVAFKEGVWEAVSIGKSSKSSLY